MSQPSVVLDHHPLYLLQLNMQAIDLTDAQFDRLCRDNPDLRLELTAQRTLVIMSPTGSKTGWRNSKLNQRLANWAEQDGTGLAFDSSTGFTLPNGAKRPPDAAWVRRARWEALNEAQQKVWPHSVPILSSNSAHQMTGSQRCRKRCLLLGLPSFPD